MMTMKSMLATGLVVITDKSCDSRNVSQFVVHVADVSMSMISRSKYYIKTSYLIKNLNWVLNQE